MIAELDMPLMSPQEYLTWEAGQPLRYGYINGQVYAMTGGTIPHNQVAVNLVALIKPHLRGKQCKTLSSDAKIGVTEQGPFHYPDVSVTCDLRDMNHGKFCDELFAGYKYLYSTTEQHQCKSYS